MKIQFINATQAWLIVEQSAKQFKQCTSINGIVYDMKVENDSIFLKAPTRNNGNLEEISKTQFLEFFSLLGELDEINTNTIKNITPSGLYKKRSLLMAVLKSSEIIK
jgi:hypothetical protein